MVNKAIVVSPEAAAYRGSPYPQQRRPKESSSCCSSCIRNLCTLIFFAALAGGAYYAYEYTDIFDSLFPGAEEEDVDNSGPGISGVGIRGNNGTDYIEIFFAQNDELSVTNAQQAPYIAAAEYWSDVLRNHTLIPGSPTFGVDSPIQTICGNPELAGNLTINGDEVVDHLIIYVDFFENAASSVLGSAGPCRCQSSGGSGLVFCSGSSALPLVGQMKFNLALDISEDVVRHEMGHVLGIGTLWQSKSLLTDPVTTIPIPDGNTDNVQPKYTGAQGVATYDSLVSGTQTFVPVEDGREADNSIRVPKLGGGSINGHWDKENMGNELMTFSISSGLGAVTSELTLKSLLDLGYNNIDLSFADSVAVDTFNTVSVTPNLRGANDYIYLYDDMIMPPQE